MLEIFLGAETLSSTIRLSVPLILACLAGLVVRTRRHCRHRS